MPTAIFFDYILFRKLTFFDKKGPAVNTIPISSAKCKQMIDEHLAAISAVLKSKSYSIGGRSLTRENLEEIRKGLDYWQAQYESALEIEARGGRRGVVVRSVIPHG